MDNPLGVQVLDSFKYFANNVNSLGFGELSLARYLFKQFTAGGELEGEVILVARLEPVVQFDYCPGKGRRVSVRHEDSRSLKSNQPAPNTDRLRDDRALSTRRFLPAQLRNLHANVSS